MTTPNPPQARSAAEIAEEEALRKQFAALQEQVLRESRLRLSQLDAFLKQNLERVAYYDRLIAKLDPFIAEVEAGPPAPGDVALLEKLRASRDLYQASKAMVTIQNHDYRANQETLRAGLEASAPQEVTFANSTQSKPYLLAKAQVDTAAARLLLVDIREPILLVQRLLNPEQPLPAETSLDPADLARIGAVLAAAPEIKPVLSLAITHYQEAQALIKEALRALRGVGEYAWELSHLMGNTSAFYKLRGKMFYLERLAEQLAPYPELAELFAKAAPDQPLPFAAAPAPANSGKLNPPARGTQPLGKQTRRLNAENNPFADRK
jgi:hypothetical protein